MSDQDKPNNGSLVPAGRCDLAPIVAANPLVSRGLTDLAQGSLLKASKSVPLDATNARAFVVAGPLVIGNNEVPAGKFGVGVNDRHTNGRPVIVSILFSSRERAELIA